MHKSKFVRVAALMLAFMFVTTIMLPPEANIFSTTVHASTGSGGGSAKRDRDHEGKKNVSEDVDYWLEINIDQSFAHQIRMATNYGNRMASQKVPLGGVDYSYHSNLKMNNVAPFWGFTEGEENVDNTNSQSGIRGERVSKSAVKYSRSLLSEALQSGFDNDDGSGQGGAYGYSTYGLMLNKLGFDQVGSDTNDPRRQLFGFVTLASYYAASSVSTIYDLVFKVLDDTNPFQFFKASTTMISSGVGALPKTGTTSPNALGKIKTFYSGIYDLFVNFSWAVTIPLALVFIIVAYFVTSSGRANVGSNLKQFIIRVIFLVMGIPILGAAYTDVLTELKKSHATCDDYMAYAIASTYLDFAGWVETNRLGVQSDAASIFAINAQKTGSSSIPAESWFNLRDKCAELNKANGVFSSAFAKKLKTTDTGAIIRDMESGSIFATDTTATAAPDSTNNRQEILSLLTRYMNGDKYTAAAFQSGTIGALERHNVKNYGDMLALSCRKYSFSQNAERTVEGLVEKSDYYDPEHPENAEPYSKVAAQRFNGGFSGDWSGVDLWTNGELQVSAGSGPPPGSGYSGYAAGVTFTGGNNSASSSKERMGCDYTQTGGFSSMAMYTYLTTEFDDSGITVYNGAPSVYTQKSHYAVNLIGSNYIMQFAFASSVISMLLGYFVLAVTYVFMAVFDVITKGFQVMGHALLGAAGFYKSIGVTICMTINMIAQLFVCVIFFTMAADLLFTVVQIFDDFLSQTSTVTALGLVSKSTYSSASADQSFKAEVMVILGNLLVTFVTIFFTSFLCRFRAVIMNAINDMSERLVGTLLGVQLSGASEGFMGNMARASLNDTLGIVKGAAAAGATAGIAGAAGDMITDGINGKDGSNGENIAEGDMGADWFANKDPWGRKAEAAAAGETPEGAALNGSAGESETRKEAQELLDSGWTGWDGTGTPPPDALGTDGKFGYFYGGTSDGKVEAKDAVKAEALSLQKENANKADTTSASDSEAASGNADSEAADSESVLPRAKSRKEQKAEADAAMDEALENGTYLDGTPSSSTYAAVSTSSGAKSGDKSDGKSENNSDVLDSGLSGEGNELSGNGNGVTSEVKETEDGKVYMQSNPITGTETMAHFDAERGLVLGIENEDGSVSDVAIGLNGFSTASTDAAGNKTVTEFNQDGMTSTYTGVDGTTETMTGNFDGLDSSMHITRTDADGNTEDITVDRNGTVKSSTATNADGSTKTVTTDDNGNVTVSEHNAATGYDSVETTQADGGSLKTEVLGNTKCVTQTDADGNIINQDITSVGEDGNPVTTHYGVADNGDVTKTVTSNGITSGTITDADGNRSDVLSYVTSDGKAVEVKTLYGNDNIADGTVETIRSAANGTVLQTTTTGSGSDTTGAYTSTVVETANGTMETKDYGNNHRVVTETSGNMTSVADYNKGSCTVTTIDAASGEKTVADISSKGTGTITRYASNGSIMDVDTISKSGSGYSIVEKDNSTGQTIETKFNSNGIGSQVITNAAGAVISSGQVDSSYVSKLGNGISIDDAGKIAASVATVAGGSIAISALSNGSAMTQSYITGGQGAATFNGSNLRQVVYTDAMSGNYSTSYDGSHVTTEYVSAAGTSGTIKSTGGNVTSSEVNYVGGGYDNTYYEGSGSKRIINIHQADMAGNTYDAVSRGGVIETESYVTKGVGSYGTVRDGASVIVNEQLMSGSQAQTTYMPDGSYVVNTTGFMGDKSQLSSTGDKIVYVADSITGIGTTAYRDGSASSQTVQYGGMGVQYVVDPNTRQNAQVFTTGGQTFSVVGTPDNTKQVLMFSDNNNASYKMPLDGSSPVTIVHNASGSSLVDIDGKSVYKDASGNVVDTPVGADAVNIDYANAIGDFASAVSKIATPIAAATVLGSKTTQTFVSKLFRMRTGVTVEEEDEQVVTETNTKSTREVKGTTSTGSKEAPKRTTPGTTDDGGTFRGGSANNK